MLETLGPLTITTFSPFLLHRKCPNHCPHTSCLTTSPYFSARLVCLCAVVVSILEKWAQHRTTDDADDNAPLYGSRAIYWLTKADPDTSPRWLAAGARGVLRGITAADSSLASTVAKNEALSALRELGLQARKHAHKERNISPSCCFSTVFL